MEQKQCTVELKTQKYRVQLDLEYHLGIKPSATD